MEQINTGFLIYFTLDVIVKYWATATFCGKNCVSGVASRTIMLYLAARTHDHAVVCLHEAHIAALREFWTDWLPTLRKIAQAELFRF